MSKNKKNAIDFEQSMQRLEAIVSQFDDGGLSLDQMESYFTEGMELIEKCSTRLDQVETRITKLLKDRQDEWAEEPFDEDDDE